MKWTQLKMNKSQWIVVILIGILLLVIAIPTGGTQQKDAEAADSQTKEQQDAYGNGYEEQLETRLETILEQIDGAGEIQAMITLKDQGESVVEKDVTNERDNTTDADGGTSTRSSSQQTTVYSSQDDPYQSKELMPQVEGILIVAQGGDNTRVQREIYDALLALFPVEVHKIKIVKMEMQEGQ